MKRFVVLLVTVILFFSMFSIISAEGEVAGESDSTVGDMALNTTGVVRDKIGGAVEFVSVDTDKFAEIVGNGILNLQGFLIGAMSFISLGFTEKVGENSSMIFLFTALLFMLIYMGLSFASILSGKFRILVSAALSFVSVLFLDIETIRSIFLMYGGGPTTSAGTSSGFMGVLISVFLPALILLAFTFRIYQRAYAGKSSTSPFYARVFNLIFLVFFGIFFMRYTTVGDTPSLLWWRYWTGWVLIGFGVFYPILFKVLGWILGKAGMGIWDKIKKGIKDRQKIASDAKAEMDAKALKAGARRSIISAENVPKGEMYSEKEISKARPGVENVSEERALPGVEVRLRHPKQVREERLRSP